MELQNIKTKFYNVFWTKSKNTTTTQQKKHIKIAPRAGNRNRDICTTESIKRQL